MKENETLAEDIDRVHRIGAFRRADIYVQSVSGMGGPAGGVKLCDNGSDVRSYWLAAENNVRRAYGLGCTF